MSLLLDLAMLAVMLDLIEGGRLYNDLSSGGKMRGASKFEGQN